MIKRKLGKIIKPKKAKIGKMNFDNYKYGRIHFLQVEVFNSKSMETLTTYLEFIEAKRLAKFLNQYIKWRESK